MSGLAYHWKEGDAHKVGRAVVVDGNRFSSIRDGRMFVLMQELHTNDLRLVEHGRLTEYHGDKTPAKQEART